MTPVFAHGQLRLYLLSLLDEAPRHGYEVIRALEDRFQGMYSPSAGTVYPRLARLEEEGLVVREESGRKSVYRITDAGRAEVRARQGDLADLDADLSASARRLAAEVRAQVRAASQDLRGELAAAAKAARASSRQAARRSQREAQDATGWTTPAGPAPGDPSAAAHVEAAVDRFAGSIRQEVRRTGVPPEAVAAVDEVLQSARQRVHALLTGGAAAT